MLELDSHYYRIATINFYCIIKHIFYEVSNSLIAIGKNSSVTKHCAELNSQVQTKYGLKYYRVNLNYLNDTCYVQTYLKHTKYQTMLLFLRWQEIAITGDFYYICECR